MLTIKVPLLWSRLGAHEMTGKTGKRFSHARFDFVNTQTATRSVNRKINVNFTGFAPKQLKHTIVHEKFTNLLIGHEN